MFYSIFLSKFRVKYKKNTKKCKKNEKKCKKICIYQKKVVPLHRQMKKTPKQHQLVTQKKIKIMKANEILTNQTFVEYGTIRLLSTFNARQHYKFYMSIGRVFPTTRPQAIEFAKRGYFNLLTAADVRMIEELCQKHGLENTCEYQLTNSGKHAHLIRTDRFINVLKKEFNF